jgi:hypothetical protein
LFGSLKADSVATETRLTTEPVEDIHDYFWKIMTSQGYRSIPQPEIMGSRVVLYRKGSDALLVQVQPVPKVGGNAIVVMRFTNFQDELGDADEEPPATTIESKGVSPTEVKQKDIPPPANEKVRQSSGGVSGATTGR